jgi:uncharacterized membrane-anchored protein
MIGGQEMMLSVEIALGIVAGVVALVLLWAIVVGIVQVIEDASYEKYLRDLQRKKRENLGKST